MGSKVFRLKRILKYKVIPSNEPDDEGTHIILMESHTKHGHNYGRVFKGTKQECLERKKELESRNVE